jgi:hypothetical protein
MTLQALLLLLLVLLLFMLLFVWPSQGDFRGKRFSIHQCLVGSDLPIAKVERASRFASSTAFLK